MVKRIYKYATGDKVPKESKYLNTVTQTKAQDEETSEWNDCWLVWHYYEVEESE